MLEKLDHYGWCRRLSLHDYIKYKENQKGNICNLMYIMRLFFYMICTAYLYNIICISMRYRMCVLFCRCMYNFCAYVIHRYWDTLHYLNLTKKKSPKLYVPSFFPYGYLNNRGAISKLVSCSWRFILAFCQMYTYISDFYGESWGNVRFQQQLGIAADSNGDGGGSSRWLCKAVLSRKSNRDLKNKNVCIYSTSRNETIFFSFAYLRVTTPTSYYCTMPCSLLKQTFVFLVDGDIPKLPHSRKQTKIRL